MKFTLNIIDGEEVVNALKLGTYNLVAAGAQFIKAATPDECGIVLHAQLMSRTPVEEQSLPTQDEHVTKDALEDEDDK